MKIKHLGNLRPFLLFFDFTKVPYEYCPKNILQLDCLPFYNIVVKTAKTAHTHAQPYINCLFLLTDQGWAGIQLMVDKVLVSGCYVDD